MTYTAPVVNEAQCQCWLLIPRRALARYWLGTAPVVILMLAENWFGNSAERWRGTGLVLPRYWHESKCWLRSDLGVLPSVGAVLAWYCQGTESKCWLRSDLGVLPSVGAVLKIYRFYQSRESKSILVSQNFVFSHFSLTIPDGNLQPARYRANTAHRANTVLA